MKEIFLPRLDLNLGPLEPNASVLPMSYAIPPDDTKLFIYKLKYLIGLNPTCPSASARIETVTWKKPFAIK